MSSIPQLILGPGTLDVQVAANTRLEQLFRANYVPVWRLLRRMGLSSSGAEDVAQQAFLVTAERLDDVLVGKERAFLFQTAYRLCLTARRLRAREALGHTGDEGSGAALPTDELADLRRARTLLDAVLSEMPDACRVVFVLFELEGLRTPEIAELLSVPLGTAASRLRRGRELFQSAAERFRKRGEA